MVGFDGSVLFFYFLLSIKNRNFAVAFGGIAGLFLGCSIISVAEVIFYLITGLAKLLFPKFNLDDKKIIVTQKY